MNNYHISLPIAALLLGACQTPLPAPSNVQIANADVGPAIEQSQAEYLAGAFVSDHSLDDTPCQFTAVALSYYVERIEQDFNRVNRVAWSIEAGYDGSPAPSSTGWAGQGTGSWKLFFRDGVIVRVALDGKPYWSAN